MAAQGAGAPIPAAASLPPPATPHNFTRVVVVGEDNTLDYLATPKAAKLIAAFPNITHLFQGKISSVFEGLFNDSGAWCVGALQHHRHWALL